MRRTRPRATALTHELLEGLQHTIRSRVLRHFRHHGLLEPHEAEDMLTGDHGGGFSLDGSRSDQILYLLPGPDLAGRTDPEPIPDHALRGARDFDRSWDA